MSEEVKRRRFNWWWLLLIASAVLSKDSTSGWVTQSNTYGTGALIVLGISEVVGTMLFALAFPLLFALGVVIFKGRGAWAKEKLTIVRTAAFLMTAFALMEFAAYLKHHWAS